MSYRQRYALFGALFGLAFPVVALLLDGGRTGAELSLRALGDLHRANPLHFVIETAPFFLGLFASFAGRREDRIRAHADVLEERVAERTASLEEALVEAREADRAKSEFLANTSHEIRTPMNGILGFAELLGDTRLDPEQTDYLETIRRSGESLLALLEDILDLGRIESGRIDLEDLDVELELMVHDVARLVRPRLEDRDVELIVDIGEEVPPRVVGDPTRLRQVLVNLAGNAAKFTERGTVTLAVRGEGLREGAGTPLVLEIRDTGIGIPADRVEAIFERFRQVDAGTNRKYGGTGLGLTICRRLVERMGGEITVTSELGRGSCFRVELPLEVAAERETLPSGPDGPPELSGMRVLIVDDLDDARTVTSRFCRKMGLRPREASSGREALEMLDESGDAIRLVVSDVLMPEEDGLDFARAVRARPGGGDYRMLAVSSWAKAGAARECRAAGFDAFLAKPLRYSVFREAIVALSGDGSRRKDSRRLVTRHDLVGMRFGSLRVLLAEDNAVNQRLAQVILSKIGVRVTTVDDGIEALAAVRAGEFDLVLMDVQMPGLDGLEATRRLRKEGCRLPIVAMTASAMKGDREKCLAAGMNDYVVKPVKRSELFDAIRRLAVEPGAPAPAPASPTPGAPAPAAPIPNP